MLFIIFQNFDESNASGIEFVLFCSVVMIREALLATSNTDAEMDITWEIAQKIAPPEIVEKCSYNRFGTDI